MATGGFADQLNCEMCLVRFHAENKVPKNLSCGDTFCHVCIQAASKQGSVECSICKETTELPSNDAKKLMTNRRIIRQLDLICDSCQNFRPTEPYDLYNQRLCKTCLPEKLEDSVAEAVATVDLKRESLRADLRDLSQRVAPLIDESAKFCSNTLQSKGETVEELRATYDQAQSLSSRLHVMRYEIHQGKNTDEPPKVTKKQHLQENDDKSYSQQSEVLFTLKHEPKSMVLHQGNIHVYNNQRISVYSLDGTLLSFYDVFEPVQALTSTITGDIIALTTGNKLRVYRGEIFIREFGIGDGRKSYQTKSISTGPDGLLYILYDNFVLVIDVAGTVIGFIQRLEFPVAMAVNPVDGNVYVGYAMAVNPVDGNVYVGHGGRIEIYTPQGMFQSNIKMQYTVHHLTFSSDGLLGVDHSTDWMNQFSITLIRSKKEVANAGVRTNPGEMLFTESGLLKCDAKNKCVRIYRKTLENQLCL